MKSRPKVSNLVLGAITNLRNENGSTLKEIVNYIGSEYNRLGTAIKRQTITALKRGVDHGFLKQNRGHYFLSDVLLPSSKIQAGECASGPPKLEDKCGKKKRRRSRSKKRGCKPKRKRRSSCKPKKRRRKLSCPSPKKKKRCAPKKKKPACPLQCDINPMRLSRSKSVASTSEDETLQRESRTQDVDTKSRVSRRSSKQPDLARSRSRCKSEGHKSVQ